mgnify:CR=1 FL=1
MRRTVLCLVVASLAHALAEFEVLYDTFYNAPKEPSALTAEATLCVQMCQSTACNIAVFDMNKASTIIRLQVD